MTRKKQDNPRKAISAYSHNAKDEGHHEKNPTSSNNNNSSNTQTLDSLSFRGEEVAGMIFPTWKNFPSITEKCSIQLESSLLNNSSHQSTTNQISTPGISHCFIPGGLNFEITPQHLTPSSLSATPFLQQKKFNREGNCRNAPFLNGLLDQKVCTPSPPPNSLTNTNDEDSSPLNFDELGISLSSGIKYNDGVSLKRNYEVNLVNNSEISRESNPIGSSRYHRRKTNQNTNNTQSMIFDFLNDQMRDYYDKEPRWDDLKFYADMWYRNMKHLQSSQTGGRTLHQTSSFNNNTNVNTTFSKEWKFPDNDGTSPQREPEATSLGYSSTTKSFRQNASIPTTLPTLSPRVKHLYKPPDDSYPLSFTNKQQGKEIYDKFCETYPFIGGYPDLNLFKFHPTFQPPLPHFNFNGGTHNNLDNHQHHHIKHHNTYFEEFFKLSNRLFSEYIGSIDASTSALFGPNLSNRPLLNPFSPNCSFNESSLHPFSGYGHGFTNCSKENTTKKFSNCTSSNAIRTDQINSQRAKNPTDFNLKTTTICPPDDYYNLYETTNSNSIKHENLYFPPLFLPPPPLLPWDKYPFKNIKNDDFPFYLPLLFPTPPNKYYHEDVLLKAHNSNTSTSHVNQQVQSRISNSNQVTGKKMLTTTPTTTTSTTINTASIISRKKLISAADLLTPTANQHIQNKQHDFSKIQALPNTILKTSSGKTGGVMVGNTILSNNGGIDDGGKKHSATNNTVVASSSGIKMVRGQNTWLSKGSKKTKDIMKCIWCGESFGSLPDLTSHMVATQHYRKIIPIMSSNANVSVNDEVKEKEDVPGNDIHRRFDDFSSSVKLDKSDSQEYITSLNRKPNDVKNHSSRLHVNDRSNQISHEAKSEVIVKNNNKRTTTCKRGIKISQNIIIKTSQNQSYIGNGTKSKLTSYPFYWQTIGVNVICN